MPRSQDASESVYASTMTIPGGLEMTTSKDVLEAIASGSGPRKLLVTLGYSAWGEGQLESELAENSWLTVSADPAVIFDTPIEERYEKALSLLGLQSWMLSPGPGTHGTQVPDVPAHFQTFLAFDFGLKRTGVAVGNRMLRTATANRRSGRRARHGWRRRKRGCRSGSPTPWWSACRSTPTAPATTIRSGRCPPGLRGRRGKPVYEVDERTAPPRPWLAARAMPTPAPASSWNSS